MSKKIFRYEMNNYLQSGLAFFGVIALVYVAFTILGVTLKVQLGIENGIQFSGFNTSTLFFVFIEGLILHRYAFSMAMAHGVSRRSLWLTNGICMLLGSAVLAVIDSVLSWLFELISKSVDKEYGFSSLYHLLYPTVTGVKGEIYETLFTFFLFVLCGALGWLISAFYYRVGNVLKITVSIAVPVLLFTGLPLLSVYVLGEQFMFKLGELMNFLFGVGILPGTKVMPLNSLVTMFVLALIVYIAAWLFIRRMPVRKQR